MFALHNVTSLKLVLAAVLCTLSTLTYASGQLVWLLGLASLLHQCLVIKNRPMIYPVVWLVLAIVFLLVWRVGFPQFPYFSSEVTSQVLLWAPEFLVDMSPLPVLERYGRFFPAILGSAFSDSSTLAAAVVGLFMLGVLLYITVRFFRHEDIRLVLCCWFAVATAAAVTADRARALTPDYILDSRYSFVSVMFLCTLTLLVQLRLKVFRLSSISIIVLLAGVYWAWAFHHFETPLQKLLNGRHSDFNRGLFLVYGKSGNEPAAIVQEAISMGIYTSPCRPFPKCESPLSREE